MAQQSGRKNHLILFLILYAGFFVYWFFFQPKPAPTPQQTQSILQQARDLEKKGREADERLVPRQDRIKSLEQAIGKYEEYYNHHKSTPEGRQARFQQVNIYDFLTHLEKGTTHWYDQAEGKLKDMEHAFLHKQGTAKLEFAGKVEEHKGDLGKIASSRLNLIRLGRDEVNRKKSWTYKILDTLVTLFGGKRYPWLSYFLALLVVVVFLKAITWPLQKKQYQSQRDMMRIQPLVKEMQEKMKGRPPEEINRRMMQIYKENNVSLTAGCLPMLIIGVALIPVFWMVRDYEYQFTFAKFLWIGTEYSRQQWWLADHLAQFDVPLFVIYLLSTVAYSLIQPKPADPQQAQQQKMMMILMPVMFGFFMWQGQWSSAFMLYWLVLNIVSLYQTWLLMRRYGIATPAAAAAGSGAVEVPAEPLAPMKGVQTARAKNGRGRGRGSSGRIRPRGAGKH